MHERTNAPMHGARARRARRRVAFCRAFVHFCICALPVALLAQQPDAARTQALARQAAERLQVLQKEADDLAAREQTLLGDLRRLEVEREIKAVELKQADLQVHDVSAQLVASGDEIQRLEREEAAERPGLEARLIETYKLGRGRYLRMLLSTSDIRRVGQATRTVAALAHIDRERVAEHQRTIARLKVERAAIEERQRQVTAARNQARRAAEEVARAAAARDALIQDIDRRRDLNARFTGELLSAQQQLQVALRNLADGTPATAVDALPIGPFRGDIPWPVNGSVRQSFGHPASTRSTSSNGMEIAAAEGATVSAVHDGVVAFADRFTGFGNLVILDHGSKAFTLYGNLLEVAVRKGDRVERGQALGTVGAPPAGQPGLYFELRVDGRPVDPLQWLKRR